MSLEKASIVWSNRQLKGMIMNGKIDFNHIVQRSYVWERSRKSALIESMIIGYPIPPVFAKRVDDGSGRRGSNIYYIMDGKQRLSTIKEYLNNEFALTEVAPINYLDDETGEECTVDISEKKFNELPDALQNYLNTVTINVVYFDNLTKEEERELFKRLNAGKPLSTKSRLLASCRDIEGLLDIGSHVLFEEMLTDKARANKNQVALVTKCWCMINMDINEISFESKLFNPLLESIKIDESMRLRMDEIFDFIVNVHTILINRRERKVAKKLYTETHMVSLIPYFKKAVEAGIDENLMADWIVDFFKTDDGASVSEDYNMATTSGVSKNMNIQTRDKALADSYAEFFKMDEDGAEDNMEVNEEVDSESAKETTETVDSEDDINDGYESFAESIMADSEEHEA